MDDIQFSKGPSGQNLEDADILSGRLGLWRDGEQVVALFEGELGWGDTITEALQAAVVKKYPKVKEVTFSGQALFDMPLLEDLPDFPEGRRE